VRVEVSIIAPVRAPRAAGRAVIRRCRRWAFVIPYVPVIEALGEHPDSLAAIEEFRAAAARAA